MNLKNLLFVMNPYAGMRKANRYLADILALFNRAGYTVVTHMTAGPGDATDAVARLASAMDLVVCCGGDGTLNETINGLLACGQNIPIGYIPAGSTNDFATSLHLPAEPLKAAEAILEGVPTAYDVGDFGGRRFSYVASFGAFTKSSYSTPQNVKNALGHTAYVLSGIQEISQLRTTHMRLELDDEVIEDDFLFGAISNSTSVGGILTLDPKQVDLQDGKFELFLVRVPRNLTELSECIQALQSQKYNCSAITFRSASQVTVSSNGPLTWTLDGERADTDGPVEIRNLHHAIRLMLKG
jgi:YegS/Rv2252/BmrU family lipid kinase